MYATGVVGFFFASTSSMILGRPEVATVDSIPARWNDLRIICVPGSPTDCAAIIPTGSPYSTKYFLLTVYFAIRITCYLPLPSLQTELLLDLPCLLHILFQSSCCLHPLR